MTYFMTTDGLGRYVFRSPTGRQEDVDFRWMLYDHGRKGYSNFQLNAIACGYEQSLVECNKRFFYDTSKPKVIKEEELFTELL